MEKVLSFWVTNPCAAFLVNGIVLIFFVGANIHKLVHYTSLSFPPGSGSYIDYSRLKLGWLIFTIVLGIFFSPALLPFYCLLKINNYNDKDSIEDYKHRGPERINRTFTRKFYFFYRDEVREDYVEPYRPMEDRFG